LQISRLKLSGFKSFVEPAELRIERGLTGIVGPNGCGKSNLLEAIRWVMGEASPKSLRGGAMDDVIFAGTSTRPPRDFAEVTILAEAVEATGGDAEVVRRIDRGAGSGYRINGNDVRARDVALMFADAATGAHSPALVSQGRISAIISAKPNDRRAMLEEAAGISGLHVRRKDAEQKLRATEANLTRLDEILADMESRVATLRRQARSAEKYRRLSTDIRRAEARLIFARWQTAAQAAEIAKAAAAAAETLVAQAVEQQRAVLAHQAERIAATATARQAALVGRDAALAAGHTLTTLRAERDGLTRRIQDIAAQAERLAADRTREGALARDAAEALATLHAEVNALDTKRLATASDLPKLIANLDTAERNVRDREVDLAKALAEQAREQAETRVAEAAVQVTQKRLDRTTLDANTSEAQLKALGDDVAILTTRNDALNEIKQAQVLVAQLNTTITQAEAARTAAVTERETIETEVGRLSSVLAALEGEANALRKTIDTGATGKRALDLVTAKPGFERALAAALGDDLEASVGAEARRVWRGAVSSPDDPPLPAHTISLIAHVRAPGELARRLSQVAVVDNDDGQRLAVGQRLVTRSGNLRRWDGMTASEHGAAAADRMIRVNRLMDVQQQIQPAREALAKARDALDRLRNEVDAARKMGESARTALAETERAVRTAQRAEDQANAALERTTARRAELASRIAEAKIERSTAEQEHQSARQARSEVPDGTGTQRLVASLNAATETARATVADLRAQRATHAREEAGFIQQIATAKAGIKSWQARAGEAAKRIEEMTGRAKAVETETNALIGAPAAFDEKIKAAKRYALECTAAAEAAQAAEQVAEAALRDIEQQAIAIGERLASAREDRAGAQARAENEELRRVEMGRVSGEKFECPPPLLPQKASFDPVTIRERGQESADLERLSMERERLGPVNLIAEQELDDIETTRAASQSEREELAEAIHRLRGSIGALNREGRARLMAAFEAVDQHFQRLFATLFNGGIARLELIDSDDPLEAGLEIFAQPPGKKLSSLSLLSGGEQALTAVALIFGLFLTNPAPICVLDEVDAPLDDANIERFCSLLDTMTRETNTRYLIVTHNAVTMSRMDRLFGVTMIEQGVSRLVSVDLTAAERLAA